MSEEASRTTASRDPAATVDAPAADTEGGLDPQWIWRAAAVLVAVLAVVVATGLSRVPPSGKTVVRYCQWSGVVHQPVVEEIEAEFETRHPGIEIQLEFYSRGYWQKLKTMQAAGTAPDVWYMAPHDMIDLARKGILEDLTPYLERDRIAMDAYFEPVMDSMRWRGRYYALGVQFGAIALYYNRDLFDAAGLAYPNTAWEEVDGRRRMVSKPWTWEDLLHAAKALTQDTDGDGAPDRFGFQVEPNLETCIAPFIHQNGGAIMTPDCTRVILDRPEAVEAIRFVRDLRWKHGFAPTPEAGGTQGFSTSQLFETGRVAMAFDGSWRIGYYNRAGTLHYDVAALPTGPAGRSGSIAPAALGNSIQAESPVKEAAWEWVKFYSSAVSQRARAAAGDAPFAGDAPASAPSTAAAPAPAPDSEAISEAIAQRLLGLRKRGIPIHRGAARSDAFLEADTPPRNEAAFLAYLDDAPPYNLSALGYGEWMRTQIVPALRVILDTPPERAPDIEATLRDATAGANEIIERIEAEQANLDRRRRVTPPATEAAP